MINRLMLSLREASDPSAVGWSLQNIPSTSKQLGLEFAQTPDEDILLFTEEGISLMIVPPPITELVTGNVQTAAAIP